MILHVLLELMLCRRRRVIGQHGAANADALAKALCDHVPLSNQ